MEKQKQHTLRGIQSAQISETDTKSESELNKSIQREKQNISEYFK